jgi:hypothetical protein
VLAEIRQLRDQGATLRGIAAALNHRAYRTRRGTAWRLKSVARILKRAAARTPRPAVRVFFVRPSGHRPLKSFRGGAPDKTVLSVIQVLLR